MRELVEYLVSQLTENAKDCSVEVEEGSNNITVFCPKNEIGKIIGKAGRTAKAIRAIVKAASKNGIRYNVEIKEIL